ncbi:tetratricopeptide repeat protein [Streptomyces filipinensis]|uniref:tetratricopeptide repeat protein n=1 Tax=Streptomyces filipinensis TaxID=66887 RepID=UPI0036E492CD
MTKASEQSLAAGHIQGDVFQFFLTREDAGGRRGGVPAARTEHLSTAVPRTARSHPSGAVPGLPPPPAAFTGRRAEVRLLLDFLRPARTGREHQPGVPVMALAGMAGVGKSALALHAAGEAVAQGWFRGGAVFVDLHGHGPAARVEPEAAAAQLLRSLGLHDDDVPSGPDDVLTALRRHLTVLDRAASPVLVVLDNAFDAGQVAPLLPATRFHRVLITSRHTLSTLDARLLDVKVMESGEGARVIERALHVARRSDPRGSGAQRATVARLAALCGGLPLALLVIAAILRADPERPLTDLIEELTDARERLEALSPEGGGGPGTGPAVRAAFDLSYQHLGPALAHAFRVMAVHPGPDLAAEAVAALTGRPVRETRRTLAELARAHLVERGRTPGGLERWSMHDLVRLYARERGEEPEYRGERDTALRRLLTFYAWRAAAVRCQVEHLDNVPAEKRFTSTAEALAWVEEEYDNITACARLALDSEGHEAAAFDLIRNLATQLVQWESGEELVTLTRLALERAATGGDAHTRLEMLSAHGVALSNADRPLEAVEILRAALGAADPGAEPEQVAMIRVALGIACKAAGRYEESAEHSRAAIAVYSGIGWPRQRQWALNNLGNALRGAGRHTESVDVHQRSVRACRELGDGYMEAKALYNLANALGDAGRFEESTAAFRRSEVLFRAAGDKSGQIHALSNLAGYLGEAGRHSEAAGAWLAIADLLRDAGDPAGEANVLASAGRELQSAADWAGVVGICRRAAALLRALDERAGEGNAWASAAAALWNQRRYAAAAVPCARAVLLLEGEQQEEAVRLLAGIRAALGREESARDDAIDALLAAAALLRRKDLRVHEGWLRNSAGLLLEKGGRLKESAYQLHRAADLFGQAGELHMRGCALNNLGVTLRGMERYAASEGAIREDLGICRAAGDEPGEALSLFNLAETLAGAGETAAAVATGELAAALYARLDRGEDAEQVRTRVGEYASGAPADSRAGLPG